MQSTIFCGQLIAHAMIWAHLTYERVAMLISMTHQSPWEVLNCSKTGTFGVLRCYIDLRVKHRYFIHSL